jgi:hypothetical protein
MICSIPGAELKAVLALDCSGTLNHLKFRAMYSEHVSVIGLTIHRFKASPLESTLLLVVGWLSNISLRVNGDQP